MEPMSTPRADIRHVLLLGATGFIGTRLLDELVGAGYQVTCAARKPPESLKCRSIEVDYSREWSETDWLPLLIGIDAVINAVGILRERGAASFHAIHVAAPRTLFGACAHAGIKTVIQLSALGADEDAASEYHRSKKEADDYLASLALPWMIVQPSLVFGAGGPSAS
jgi:uncharacterized protein YbjT (DUF2867 family)